MCTSYLGEHVELEREGHVRMRVLLPEQLGTKQVASLYMNATHKQLQLVHTANIDPQVKTKAARGRGLSKAT